MWVVAEGPEPVQMNIGAEFQCQANHDYSGAKPHCSHALGAPEDGQTLKVFRVEEDGSDGAFEVLDCVSDSEGHAGVVAKGEGGDEQQGVAVGSHVLHKRAATPIKSTIPERQQQVFNTRDKRKMLNWQCSVIMFSLTFQERCSGSPSQDQSWRPRVSHNRFAKEEGYTWGSNKEDEDNVLQKFKRVNVSVLIFHIRFLTWWQTELNRSSVHSYCCSGSHRSQRLHTCQTSYLGKDAPAINTNRKCITKLSYRWWWFSLST